MSRWKDVNWNCGDGDRVASTDHAQLAVLMDIRDELKKLNGVLHCPNFLSVPAKLDHIRRNTAKRRRRAPAKAGRS